MKHEVQLSYAMSVKVIVDTQKLADEWFTLESRILGRDIFDVAEEKFFDWLRGERANKTLDDDVDVQTVVLDESSIEPLDDRGESNE